MGIISKVIKKLDQMFFLIQRLESLALHPKYFDNNTIEKISNKLKNVEGKITGKYGFTILVTQIIKIGKGLLNDCTGFAHFPIKYWALVLRPFKGEVIPAEVKTISKQGLFAHAGPLEVFISKQQMPDELVFDNNSGINYFIGEEDKIENGTIIRIRIFGLRFSSSDINCVGTIREDYLGVLN